MIQSQKVYLKSSDWLNCKVWGINLVSFLRMKQKCSPESACKSMLVTAWTVQLFIMLPVVRESLKLISGTVQVEKSTCTF